MDAYDGTTYKNESAGWNCEWYRCRLRLSETLPYDYSESFLAIVYQYAPNPDYGLGGAYTDDRWVRTGIREVTPMTLTIPAGERTGAWKFQSPTVAAAGKYVGVQMVPVKIEIKTSGSYTPDPENEAHDKLVFANGLDSNGQQIDQLGALPIGLGRLDDAASNNSYVAPMETSAVVPDVPGLSWKWKRSVNFRCWKIHLGRETPTSAINWLVSLQLHQEDPDDDPSSIHQDVTRSAATGRIYTGDNSGINLRLEALGLVPNDYFYEERQFTYSLECTFDSQPAFIASSLGIGQVMKLKNNANIYPVQNGNFDLNFDAIENSNAVRVMDLKISAGEVRAIVGGNVPINIPPSVNN